jgi:hypothetical protein
LKEHKPKTVKRLKLAKVDFDWEAIAAMEYRLVNRFTR